MIKGKLLGIDHGIKRIGIATSDASGMVARELCVIRRKSKAEDFARIQQIIMEQQPTAIIIGMPFNDSAPGQHHQADTVQRWADQLAENISLPIIFWDERFSSVDARELARSKRRKPTDPIDDLAARLMLQSYLDAVYDGLAEPPSPEKASKSEKE